MYNMTEAGVTETKFYMYRKQPKTITTVAALAEADKRTAADIKDLECLVEELKQYRKELADRCNELYQMDSKISVKLERDKRWKDSKVYYNIITTRVYTDGTKAIVGAVSYGGTERNKAFRKFAEMKKHFPNYEYSEDIEKKSWEKR